MIREAVKKDRRIEAHIDEVIKLASNIIRKGPEEEEAERIQ